MCVGNPKREQVAGNVCRKPQERADCRKCVQETSRESRLQEMCSGNNKKCKNYVQETAIKRTLQKSISVQKTAKKKRFHGTGTVCRKQQ